MLSRPMLPLYNKNIQAAKRHISLCRRYLECLAFSVQWKKERFGNCNIYGVYVQQSDLVIKQDVTTYMPCPPNFDWDPYVKKCYSIQLLGPAFWTDAVDQCRNTHPRSKLVEPRNALENRRLGVLAGGGGLWLGLYRPSISTDIYDIRYASDGQPIGYSQWASSQPNGNGGMEDVVFAENPTYNWLDRSKMQRCGFLCEI
ncbi:hypothetical protein LSH36_1848g00005 [Paralvinella palmiformis]|uniref:C-type lectin domain-containing protein n=1 Tax=Paralvinella palmiformis TaxID=53620 RepID=A0AAD9MLL3_9ANNE|nr:hypothetical protein LSH36_1848g00005 [Paralvinella palmiformis]